MLRLHCRVAPLRVAKLYKRMLSKDATPEPEFSFRESLACAASPNLFATLIAILMRKREADNVASRGDRHVLNSIDRITHR